MPTSIHPATDSVVTGARSKLASSLCNTVVGVDFAGPSRAGQQRRKIVALAAERLESGRYRVGADGFNARVASEGPPGWTAQELAEALEGPLRPSLVACDFPFSIPAKVLQDPNFAADVGLDAPFADWRTFNAFLADNVSLSCPIDLSSFSRWKTDSRYWLKRASDIPAAAQPALKHMYQVLFNMTLLGGAFLARLSASGRFRVDPFEAPREGVGTLIEVYPGVTMRRLGARNYKRDPAGAIDAILLHCRDQGIDVEVDPRVRERCETYGMNRKSPDPDASDALIAACTAVLQQEGLCEQIRGDASDEVTALEGAIWAVRRQASPRLPPALERRRRHHERGGGELAAGLDDLGHLRVEDLDVEDLLDLAIEAWAEAVYEPKE